MAGQIEGKLHANVPQALGIPGYSRIMDRSHDLSAILDWTKILKISFMLNCFINHCETSKLWSSGDGKAGFGHVAQGLHQPTRDQEPPPPTGSSRIKPSHLKKRYQVFTIIMPSISVFPSVQNKDYQIYIERLQLIVVKVLTCLGLRPRTTSFPKAIMLLLLVLWR